jgi:hypothetical protein
MSEEAPIQPINLEAATAPEPAMPEDPKEAKKVEEVHAHAAKHASWGAVISILIILIMIVVGAFYSWGHRVAQQHPEAVQAQ